MHTIFGCAGNLCTSDVSLRACTTHFCLLFADITQQNVRELSARKEWVVLMFTTKSAMKELEKFNLKHSTEKKAGDFGREAEGGNR